MPKVFKNKPINYYYNKLLIELFDIKKIYKFFKNN